MSMWVAGAIVTTGVYSAYQAGEGQKAMERSGAQQVKESRRQYDQTREDTSQYREVGGRALSMLERMTTGDYDITESPGYQFRLEEGYKGLERSQAGRRLGGRAAKEAIRYGSDYASSEYGAEFNRMSQLANYGVGGTAQAIQGGANASAGIRQGYATQGQAGMQGAQGMNQAIQGTAQNLAMWSMYNQGGSGYATPLSQLGAQGAGPVG